MNDKDKGNVVLVSIVYHVIKAYRKS